MGMNPRLLRPTATGFDPRRIAGLGMWLDASDRSTLSQTSDGSTAVASNNDPVAYWKDKITGVALTQAIDANRPLWLASGIGGRPGLDFDGSNDVLFAGSGSLMGLVRNVGAATVITAHKWNSTANSLGFIFFSSAGNAATAGRLTLGRDGADGTRYSVGARRVDGTAAAGIQAPAGSLTTNSAIATAIYRTSAAQVSLRVDGVAQITNAAFQTAGNTSNTDSLQISVGAVSGASVFAPMVLSECMVWPRELTLAEIQAVERYLSRRYGVSVA
jgi:hypothetical protein